MTPYRNEFYYERRDFIIADIGVKGPKLFPRARKALVSRIASFKRTLGSKSEKEIALWRTSSFREAVTRADKENPKFSATLLASLFTLGSILILSIAVFIYLKYILCNFYVKDYITKHVILFLPNYLPNRSAPQVGCQFYTANMTFGVHLA